MLDLARPRPRGHKEHFWNKAFRAARASAPAGAQDQPQPRCLPALSQWTSSETLHIN